VTSQGQRFRRRALRRGYKVDEVDAFLDRVEATLAGDPIGAPVTAQEVHDVVFRVRFGGYDEWQVDLHLDRVERQLGDVEERTGGFIRPAGQDRLAALREEPMEPRRPTVPPPPMPTRPLAPAAQMSGPPMGGSYLGSPLGGPPMSGPPMMGNGMPPMMAPPPMSAPPLRPMSGPPLPPLPPMRPMSAPPLRPMSAPPLPVGGNGYPRFDEPEYPTGGFQAGGLGHNFREPAPQQVGRRGRMDMTHEVRFDLNSSMPTSGGPASPTELQRIDSMRRTFTARRFGSGYDAMQVNRLFDAIIASLSGRSGMPLSENELDPNQFSLVPGGYFEAEVNQALREVRDLVRR
jgi:DivIVA domain-containing protein